MTTTKDLTDRHPALIHTGTSKMNFNVLQIGAEILDALLAVQNVTLNHLWGYDPNVYNTEHHSGQALDFMVHRDRTAGDFIADYVIGHEERLALIHILWRQRIYRGPMSKSQNEKGVWMPMEDRGTSTKNHMDHPHAFFMGTPYILYPTNRGGC